MPEITIAIVTAVFVLRRAHLDVARAGAVVALRGAHHRPGHPLVLQASPHGYRQEMSSYANVNAGVAEAVDAGRTVEAYRLGPARVQRTDNAIKRWIGWERYTLYLRTVFFPSVEIAYVLPLAAVLAMGGWLYANGQVSLAQVTAAVLYTQMLIEPVDIILMWYDELQVGQASLARLLGVHDVPDPETDDRSEPGSAELEVRDVRFGYREDVTCCTESSSTSRPANESPSLGLPAPESQRSDD